MKIATIVAAISLFAMNATAGESEQRILVREAGYIYQGHTYKGINELKSVLDPLPPNHSISYHFLPCSERINSLKNSLETYLKIRNFSKVSSSFPLCGCHCGSDKVQEIPNKARQ
ncbi:hypothetical protein KUV22_16265 [Microbulbifer agarilyticus]|uniref:hypothetical protein n=1 Tax=Microbulbifer agarilyticus TaxID=260552 RepID=UPI001C94D3B8|nr:hypothetical protein [Microbulbifer agarilyticus]MBY6191983.1 hypothetical protein [Microbulbifer agarilyticus]